MKHIEYAQAVLQAFSEYADYIENKKDKTILLELCADGSGCVRDGDTNNALFQFDDLKELLILLLVNEHKYMQKIRKNLDNLMHT